MNSNSDKLFDEYHQDLLDNLKGESEENYARKSTALSYTYSLIDKNYNQQISTKILEDYFDRKSNTETTLPLIKKLGISSNLKSGLAGYRATFPQYKECTENKCLKDDHLDNYKTELETLFKALYSNEKRENEENRTKFPSFKPASEELRLKIQKNGRNKFVSPLISHKSAEEARSKSPEPQNHPIDERLKNIEPKMVNLIESEIMDLTGNGLSWDAIAGLEFAKCAIKEAVVWPMLRPDIFTGLRRPPRGILLFGPPGTGKTLIGKCVASQSKSTFFNISASSLTSKWIGDGEKMVRALFTVAKCHQPAVIFIDEIDSLLSQRSESEHESSRRMKTEFLVQIDGVSTINDRNENILLIGATNRPQELDEAARRRFVKRLYIPLPEKNARKQLVLNLIKEERHEIGDEDLEKIATLSDGFSGSDMRQLCAEASLGPIRSLDISKIENIDEAEVSALKMVDFDEAFKRVRASVSQSDLNQYVAWDKTYGCGF